MTVAHWIRGITCSCHSTSNAFAKHLRGYSRCKGVISMVFYCNLKPPHNRFTLVWLKSIFKIPSCLQLSAFIGAVSAEVSVWMIKRLSSKTKGYTVLQPWRECSNGVSHAPAAYTSHWKFFHVKVFQTRKPWFGLSPT